MTCSRTESLDGQRDLAYSCFKCFVYCQNCVNSEEENIAAAGFENFLEFSVIIRPCYIKSRTFDLLC